MAVIPQPNSSIFQYPPNFPNGQVSDAWLAYFTSISGSALPLPPPSAGFAIGWDGGGNLINVANTGANQTAAWTAADAVVTSAFQSADLAAIVSAKSQTLSSLAATNGASLVGYAAPYTGAVATTQSGVNSRIFSVFDFLTSAQKTDVLAWTFSLDLTTAFANIITALPAYATLVFPSGGYFGSLSIQRDNITLRGAGSASCMIKAATLSTGGVIECGNTALGNGAPARVNLNVYGFTLDGNYGVIPTATDDLHGHGLCQTAVSYSNVDDVVAQNCNNTGYGTFINSNFNQTRVRVKNCGNATPGGAHYPNFDINSSKYSIYDVISEGGYYGARMLDNCYGNHLRATVYNASLQGAVLNNQTVNESHDNKVDVTVIGGCSQVGVNVSANWNNGIVNAAVSDVTGIGFIEAGAAQGLLAANFPTGNIFNVITRNGQVQGSFLGASFNICNIQSYQDGRGGGPGTNFAIDVNGNNDEIKALVQDTAVWQVRGITFRAGSSNNRLLSYDWTNTTDPLQHLGTGNLVTHTPGQGANIASAATITLPFNGSEFNITGTTGPITAIGQPSINTGRTVSLRFVTGTMQITNSATLVLNGGINLNPVVAGTIITFGCDGTNWYEKARKV